MFPKPAQPNIPPMSPEMLAVLASQAGMTPPGPPPATPASAGFAAWASDPQTQTKIANSLVKPGQPLMPPNAAPAMQQADAQPTHAPAVPGAVPPYMPPAPAAMSAQAPASAPTAAVPPPAADASPMMPPTTQSASVTASAPFPSYAEWSQANPQSLATPKFERHHGAGGVATDIGQLAVAALAGVGGGINHDPGAGLRYVKEQQDYDRSVPDINQERYKKAVIEPTQAGVALQNVAAQIGQRTSTAGLNDAKAAVIPQQQALKEIVKGVVKNEDGSYAIDPASPYSKNLAASTAIHNANAELSTIKAENQRNHFVEGTPQWAEGQRKLQQVDDKLKVALGNLGLRKAEYNAHATGTGPDGKTPLAGANFTPEGDSVGTWMNPNVKPTTQQQDAAGRAESMVDISNRIRAGLADPEIQSYMGPLRGRVSSAQGDAGILPEKIAKFRNDLVSYGAFQAGLHPVRGIGALQYFDKVMGGLGQDPNQLLGKLNSNDDTAASVQRVGEMPNAAHIKAMQKPGPVGPSRFGQHMSTPPSQGGGTRTFTDGGVTYSIPVEHVAEFKKDHPHAR